MSGFAHPQTQIQLHRPRLLIALAVVVAATALVLVLTLGGGDSAKSGATVAPLSATSGPNETARGNSAATASGATPQRVVVGLDTRFRGRSAVIWSQP